MKSKYTQYLIYALSAGCLIILVLLMMDLSDTIDKLAISSIDEKKEQTINELNRFFNPIVRDIATTIERGESGFFDNFSLSGFNAYFVPFLQNSDQISSMMMAQPNGDEKMLLQLSDKWINRHTFKGSKFRKAKRHSWKYEKGSFIKIKSWPEKKMYDPRKRPWYIGAMQQQGRTSWSKPYTFFTTKDPGITLSRQWRNPKGEVFVFGFDLMLMDISEFTSALSVSENGKAFILTDDDRVLGLPRDVQFSSREALKNYVLKPLSEIRMPVLISAISAWNNAAANRDAFSFQYEGEKWWGTVSHYYLGQNEFRVGVIVPESDYLADIQETRTLIFAGFILILLFTLIISRFYQKIQATNVLLQKSNVEIEKQRDHVKSQHQLVKEQKLIVEDKNKEILASISYAQRIQKAILPTDKDFAKLLPENFVYYQPKDIVAGDFYWLNETSDTNEVLIAAADCTGHGVPGAIVSVVCHNSLNRSVNEFGLTTPALILDSAKKLVIETFSKSDAEVKDGMDIALCKVNFKNRTIEYAGAHNSLYIVRSGINELQEIKADKQPVGKYAKSKAFTNHQFQLDKGDIIYMHSDGFADQFGGPAGKKFNYKRFRELLLEIHDEPMQAQMSILKERFTLWIQQSDESGESYEQLDDICIIGLRL